MTERRYPKIGEPPPERRLKTEHSHSEVEVTWAEGEEPRLYCGDNNCTGWCGLTALMMPTPKTGQPLKCSGAQVACGPAFQNLRVAWRGPVEQAPTEHHEDFVKRWYQ